jgi:nucleotidyltransferase/DNA polymerase involved in DNA repair
VRDVWGFDPLVQLLANRGCAVLQMNYRGSPGYGEELYEMARRQIGKAIQDDIEDATRWAIAAGVADPKHIAIMGAQLRQRAAAAADLHGTSRVSGKEPRAGGAMTAGL